MTPYRPPSFRSDAKMLCGKNRKSIIAILNTMKREFAHNGYRFYDFIQGGILHTLEINCKVNFGWLFEVKTGGRKEYIYAGEKFKEIAPERYKNF